MHKQKPSSIVWLLRIIKFSLFAQFFLILYLFYLSLFVQQPILASDGFNRGLVESMLGISDDSAIYFTTHLASYLTGNILFFSILYGIVLFLIKKRKLKIVRAIFIFLILAAIGNGQILSAVLPMVLLILSFQKTAAHYFHSQK